MQTYDQNAIAAAFSIVARLVREEKPVILTKVDGLNVTNYRWFREAVTHTFTQEKHGVDLQKIFIIDKDNPQIWHRNTSPNRNPQDIELIKRIIVAMSVASKEFRKNRPEKPVKTAVIQEKSLADYSLEELRAEVQKREKLIAKEHYAKQLECSVEELPKIVESILALL
jgi:hypothetical protein